MDMGPKPPLTKRAIARRFAAVLLILLSIAAVLPRLIRALRAPRMLGGSVAVQINDVPPHGFLGAQFGAASTLPLSIVHVVAGSGADAAGLRDGDAIMSAGRVQQPDRAAILSLLEKTVPGDTLVLRIRRGRAEMEVAVKLIGWTDLLDLEMNERLRLAE
jgi:S1-C subfamily serine protease